MLTRIIELSLTRVSTFGGDMSLEDYRCGSHILHAVVPKRLNQLAREGCVQTFKVLSDMAARERAQFHVNMKQAATRDGRIRADMRRKLAQIEHIIRP